MLIWTILGLYFLPAVVASARGHHNSGSIFVLNLFLGFVPVAWVFALVWACSQCDLLLELRRSFSSKTY
jgi:T4 superinfection immunity protein